MWEMRPPGGSLTRAAFSGEWLWKTLLITGHSTSLSRPNPLLKNVQLLQCSFAVQLQGTLLVSAEATALHLVAIQADLGSKAAMFAIAWHQNYPQEHVSVGVSGSTVQGCIAARLSIFGVAKFCVPH